MPIGKVEELGRDMKILRRARREAANEPRLRSVLALAALWLLACAPAPVCGQDTTTHAPPVMTDAATKTTTHTMPPADALPAQPMATPSISGKEATEKEATEAVEPEDGRTTPQDSTNLDPVTDDPAENTTPNGSGDGFRWKSATEQALLFLGIQHGYAFTQPKTRRDLSGPFFRDYFRSVGSLSKWEDGGRFFTNYVAHPMQGALLGHVYVENDPKGKSAQFGRSKAYWHSRAKAVAWSAAWSTQFEIGPVSQASIGNVGLHGKQTWVDIVVTPTGGAVWLVAEDALDRFVVRRIEERFKNHFLKIAARMLFNPTRSGANLLRFEKPWHRDR